MTEKEAEQQIIDAAVEQGAVYDPRKGWHISDAYKVLAPLKTRGAERHTRHGQFLNFGLKPAGGFFED